MPYLLFALVLATSTGPTDTARLFALMDEKCAVEKPPKPAPANPEVAARQRAVEQAHTMLEIQCGRLAPQRALAARLVDCEARGDCAAIAEQMKPLRLIAEDIEAAERAYVAARAALPGASAPAPAEADGVEGKPVASPDPASVGVLTPPLPPADHVWKNGRAAATEVAPPVIERGDVHVVGRKGDFEAIGRALAAADPGDVIRVRPGTYEEALYIDKSVIIEGGPGVEVRSRGASTIQVVSGDVIIRDLKLRQVADPRRYFGVELQGGHVQLEGCDITSQHLSGVIVHPRAQAFLKGNIIHDTGQAGVFVRDGGQATLVGNDISAAGNANVEAKASAVTVRGNKIHDGRRGGVFFHTGSVGVVEGNEIWGHRSAGVELARDADPIVRKNTVRDNLAAGVFVNGNARGLIVDNVVSGSAYAGIEVREADPVVGRNRVVDGRQAGVYVSLGGLGLYEGNTIERNGGSGVEIRGGAATVVANTIRDNKGAAIYCREGCTGRVVGNKLSGNGQVWHVVEGSSTGLVRSENVVE